MNKREVGAQKEKIAAEYLIRNGLRIIEKNYRCRQGEIDLIAYHENYLVFIEVKYRRDNACGAPEEAVGKQKQSTICRVADYYRYCKKISEFSPMRYDVISMVDEKITWHQNAFSHKYR